jgi:NAD(P)-dependent dehydrogenase (short-subunit alcohol dehydrogenase family)
MKSVLITGAYGGMGKAIAKLLSNRGIRVFALDKNVEEMRENVIPIKADITDKNSIEEAFLHIKGYTDELFAIIHFAGVYMLDSLVEIGEKEYDKIFDINVKGAFMINKTFLPLLKNGSRIVITTSELAPLYPLPFTGIYAVTKTALDRYAYSLRMELQLLGINVSTLRAGAVKTDMLGASTSALDKFCDNTSLYSFSAKRFKNIVGTACGDTFISKQKTFLVDIDTKDIKVIQKIRNFIENSCKPIRESENKIITSIPTLNGVHLICKPFDISDFKKQYPLIDIHKNNPTVLYFNKKD